MIITKKAIPRRTVLRGLGATLALPLLDGMVPAFAQLRNSAAKPVLRMGWFYGGNGQAMRNWTPATEGALQLSPILEPLAPFRDRLLVLGNLSSFVADAQGDEGAGGHSRAQPSFLTGAHPKKTEGVDIRTGISVDQIAANQLGQQTQLPSIELCLESAGQLVGGCDNGYSCAYTSTIAWRSPTTPLPMEPDPRAVFERLFGASDSTDPAVRLARLEKQRSILDAVSEDVARLRKGLGPRDVTKLSEYLEAVRDVERRIQMAEKHAGDELPVVEQPAGIPPVFEEHAKLMLDLLALTYQTDLTRVATFMMSPEISMRAYPEIGVNEPHHPTSHHRNLPELIDKLTKINVFHMQMFAHFLKKLQSIPDGDGSLLDHVLFLYGTGLSNSNEHYTHDLPIMLVGGETARIEGGRHIRFAKELPLANLHLTMLEKMGAPIENFGDSNGKLELLTDV